MREIRMKFSNNLTDENPPALASFSTTFSGDFDALLIAPRIAMRSVIFPIIFLCLHGIGNASHVEIVDPQSVVLSYQKYGVEVVLGKDDAGNLASIKVTRDGEVYEVPAEELIGCGKNVRIGLARIVIGFAHGGRRLERASFGGFDLSIPCAKNEMILEGEQTRLLDEVTFTFFHGKLEKRMRTVYTESENTVAVFFKTPGNPEEGTTHTYSPKESE